MLEQRA